jgi:alkaline phosphatase D
MRYAVFSCSNFGWGYFNAYADAAARGLDFWLHLGDYYYDYGEDAYPSRTQVRKMPSWPKFSPL